MREIRGYCVWVGVCKWENFEKEGERDGRKEEGKLVELECVSKWWCKCVLFVLRERGKNKEPRGRGKLVEWVYGVVVWWWILYKIEKKRDGRWSVRLG